MTAAVDVLVAGAGPTGLTLAFQAHDHGARIRIVERRTNAFRPSRALILHPRTLAAPRAAPAVPLLLNRRRLVAEGIRLISQLRAHYRRSPLSVEGAPRLRSAPRRGDRLPDATVSVGGPPLRLHGLLARPGVHLLLQSDADSLPDAVLGPHVTVVRLTNSPGRGVVAIRPDGHVGFRCGTADAAGLSDWLSLIGQAASPPNRS